MKIGQYKKKDGNFIDCLIVNLDEQSKLCNAFLDDVSKVKVDNMYFMTIKGVMIVWRE